jgi:hypothetical protein
VKIATISPNLANFREYFAPTESSRLLGDEVLVHYQSEERLIPKESNTLDDLCQVSGSGSSRNICQPLAPIFFSALYGAKPIR